ncbi:MAG: hypothetical protein K2N18_03800 [Clostridia bacterium]|nr:hypothetical protein [Clostridia bacterium]
MKQFKPTALRKTSLLLVVLTLIVCMSIAFVACGENDNDGNGDTFDGKISISIDSIDSKQFNQTLNGILGYLYSHNQEYTHSFMSGYYIQSNDDHWHENLLLIIYSYNYDSDNDHIVDEATCMLAFFKTEQEASENLDAVKDDLGEHIITKEGSVIIVETQKGLYNAIKNSTLPESKDDILNAKLQFINSALKKGLNKNFSSAYFSCEGYLERIFFNAEPEQGNIYIDYHCFPKEYYDNEIKDYPDSSLKDMVNADLAQYSSDSYVKYSDDTYYIYLQRKPGFVFEENENKTAYIITNYYYNELPKTLVIPATYNNKPVEGMDLEFYISDIWEEEITEITIPSSIRYLRGFGLSNENLKIINYQGTKKQWKEFYDDTHSLNNIDVIHCSDGDIIPSDIIILSFEEALSQLKDGTISSFSCSGHGSNHIETYISNDMIYIASHFENDPVFYYIAILESDWHYVVSNIPDGLAVYYKYDTQTWEDNFKLICSQELYPLFGFCDYDEINKPHPAIPEEFRNYREIAVEQA